jgi:hypothetical protein
MTRDCAYANPAAFRRALIDKLRAVATTSRWSLPQFQRQMAYDRLLERLYLVDDAWIVKGATALLARDLGVRGTTDIDVYRESAPDAAETDLREAAGHDIGDWFRFEIGAPGPVSGEAPAVRFPVTAFVGATKWAQFHVDLVGMELRMTGQPEPCCRLLASLWRTSNSTATACIRSSTTSPTRSQPSSSGTDGAITFHTIQGPNRFGRDRHRCGASVDAHAQRAALASEVTRRNITLPVRFIVPDRPMWEQGYASEARRSLLMVAQTLDEALEIVGRFVDPLVDGTAEGHWDPYNVTWSL